MPPIKSGGRVQLMCETSTDRVMSALPRIMSPRQTDNVISRNAKRDQQTGMTVDGGRRRGRG